MTAQHRSPSLRFLVAAALASLPGVTADADWPQWRGPDRNGVAYSSPPLAERWPRTGPPLLWESQYIPARNDGGLASVVVADGRVFLYVLWHEDKPIPTRAIDDRVLRRLDWLPEMPPDDLLRQAEAARLSDDRQAMTNGGEIRDWARAWVDQHAPDDDKELRKFRGWIENRLRDGEEAVPLDAVAKLATKRDHTFPDQAAFEKWLDGQRFDDQTRQRIVREVATTVRVADDVVLCLDAATGKMLWESRFEAEPTGHRASSTPCVVGGRLYVAGQGSAYCLDTKTGAAIWKAPLRSRAVPSSFLVIDGKAVILARQLTALSTETGRELWCNEDVRGEQSSPVAWEHGGRTFVICNTGRDEIACVDLATGQLAWTAPGGGIATPAVQGDHLVVHCKDEKLGLVAYRLTPTGAEQAWSIPIKGRGASSPIIHDGHVYLCGAGQFLCAKLDTGEIAWRKKSRAEISSPLLADARLFALEGSGSTLLMLSASPAAFKELSKARVNAEWCPSPGFADGRLYLRHKDKVACYDLRRE